MMFLTALSTLLVPFAGGGWFLAPLFWLLLIVGIVFLVRSRGRYPLWASGGRETGMDVLERRFAEGEISLDEYRERRSVLEEKQ
jgi:putative membrane protein